MRRTLTIVAVVVVLGGLGVWMYFAFSASQASVEVSPNTNTETSFPGSTQNPINPITATTSAASLSPLQPATPVTVGQRLVKISSGPVVPNPIVYRSTSSTTPGFFVNYIERQSGNVFSYSSAARSITRTSNKTVPGIQSAAWLPNAQTAFVRYLSGTDSATINTYALSANGANGFFLEQNLADIAVSSTSILTIASGVNGSVATTHHTDGTHPSPVFSSALSSLRVALSSKSRFAFTKPSVTLAGAVFLVDNAGHFSRIAGPLNGLVALPSPSGATVLVSYVIDGAMQMELVTTTTGAVTTLPVATIADKCVWTADSSNIYCGIPMNPPANYAYPDDWYQGTVSFSDRIWKINVAGRYAELVLDFSKENKSDLDARSFSVDSAGTALAFINKTDSSLWVYGL